MLEIKATLRVISKELELTELVEIFGVTSRGFSFGDSYSTNKKRDISMWTYTSKKSITDTLDSHLSDILGFYESKADKFRDVKEKCKFDVFCMLSSNNGQGGTTLTHQTMMGLANYELNIIFDVYAEME